MRRRFSVGTYGPMAMITGLDTALGVEYAWRLAEQGFDLLLVGQDHERLNPLADRIQLTKQNDVRTVVADLSQREDISRVIEVARGLDVGLLVHTDGGRSALSFGEASEDELELRETLNITAATRLVRRLGGGMLAQGRGGIILVGNPMGYQAVPGHAAHAAAMAHLLILGESLHREWKEQGVDVLAVTPSGMRAPLSDAPDVFCSRLPVTEVETVVRQSFRALGRKPSLIPGFANRVLFAWLPRFLPRAWHSAIPAWFGRASRPRPVQEQEAIPLGDTPRSRPGFSTM